MQRDKGKNHAIIGAALVAFSTGVPYLLIALTIMISEGTYMCITAMGTVGLAMIFAGVIKYKYRAPWTFLFLVTYALLLLRNPPIGTAIALFTYYYLGKTWRSFFGRTS